ncbi:PHA/PHB synthase family protein [Dongia soli]|uniref:Class I poly(R)-hydroxyalkanoic acid synthase n=1 Tax=Dongia soli TaxID=600628 RepID=A0ABU5EAP6_9PROT|nr:class I poly(R)-hydroxyalkanoic acid synthase [Dongia soli]MDY0883319.1 class I poly(R)-hydroxyalkanoic acid synthase [Dongia soli]
MAEQPDLENKGTDPAAWSEAMAKIAEQSQRLVSDFLSRNADDIGAQADPLNIGRAFLEMTSRLMADPQKLVEAQISLWQDYMNLWQNTARRMMGGEAEPVIKPAADDRRFKDAAWQDNQVFDYIKQSYLLTARWLQSTVHNVEGLDRRTAQKVDFYTRQFVDAMAPNNFAMTNPEVLRATAESGGENLVKGLQNLLEDLERGKGKLAIRMTDLEAFEIGRNIAVTPGKVVFQNGLMQLLQYEPVTEKVAKRPLLVIPPWINKYYILDLKPANSLIKWLVEQGHTVFVISWVNPDEKLAAKSFEDYMNEGPLAAIDAMEAITGESSANVIGYCLGGTLLACTLAYLTASKKQDRIASATFMTTMVDFAEAGELAVFVDEEQLASLEARMSQQGYLEGTAMANTFNMLRANDLIWSFVINNYLLGKEPFPFDLLYWNSDATRMPAAMHSFYLRNMYQENRLSKPGGLTLKGVPIDLTKIKTPAFILSTKEDHIAPWKSTYAATQLYRGPVKFVLASSGHIAGVVNPPAANKYNHWVNEAKTLPKKPDDWLAGAEIRPASWWPEWQKWVTTHSGGTVPARKPGNNKMKPIEDAPGSYVRVRS